MIGSEKRTFIGPGNPNKTGDHLGPGYYEEDQDFKMQQNKASGKGFSIPKAGPDNTNKSKSKSVVPGPGNYNHNREALYGSVNGGSMAKTGRDNFYGKSSNGSVPGPGRYGGSRSKPMAVTGGFKFGKEKRGIDLMGNLVPGPGQYSKQSAKVS